MHRLTEPMALGSSDSTAEGGLRLAGWPGEKPVVSGGTVITGWRKAGDGLWAAEAPAARPNGWFGQLFVNGQRRSRSRLPKQGVLRIEGAIEPRGGHSDANKSGFRFKPGDIRKDWKAIQDVEVVVLQFWAEARLRIREIDDKDNIVRFTGSSWRSLSWNCGYYVENVWEAFTEPGQWYLDRSDGILYYRPLPGEDMAKAEVIAPTLQQLVRLEGDPQSGRWVENVEIQGLSFQHTAWELPDEGYAYAQAELHAPAAVWAEGIRNCTVEDCEFTHLGGWAIDFGRGCKSNQILANRFTDLGCGGVRIGEPVNRPDDADEACGNIIEDNAFTDGSLVYLGSPAIWVGQSSRNRIAHNEVSGDWHWAVSVGWNWQYLPPNRTRDNLIEHNHLHDLGTGTLGMHGAIYTLGLSPGTVIRGNLIHGVRGWPYYDGAGMGIILDNGCAGIVVEDNVVRTAQWGGMGFNYNCLGNIIQNNVFAYGERGQLNRYGDPCPGGQKAPPNANFFIRNIVYWNSGRLYREEQWPNYDTISDYNLYFDASGRPVSFLGFTFDEWKEKGLDTNSQVADPLFVDPENGDFGLRPGSPALAIGFRPIDLTSVGPRRP
jgi:hypothetical protein